MEKSLPTFSLSPGKIGTQPDCVPVRSFQQPLDALNLIFWAIIPGKDAANLIQMNQLEPQRLALLNQSLCPGLSLLELRSQILECIGQDLVQFIIRRHWSLP